MMVFARGLAKLISGGQKISTAVQLPDGSYNYVDVPPIFDTHRRAHRRRQHRCRLDHHAGVDAAVRNTPLPHALGTTDVRRGRERGSRTVLRHLRERNQGHSPTASCGLFCAVAGICQAAQELQGDPEAGSTYELSAIAMVVIGGTSLQGGRGSIWLTLLGVLIIGNLEKILSINAVGEETRLMLTGVIILGAVLLQQRQ